jgi:hypothetical protein
MPIWKVLAESAIYIVCDPHQKEAVDGLVDQFNPELQTERSPRLQALPDVPADSIPSSVVVGRLRRQKYGADMRRTLNLFRPALHVEL